VCQVDELRALLRALQLPILGMFSSASHDEFIVIEIYMNIPNERLGLRA
jgi:hypothetical protein